MEIWKIIPDHEMYEVSDLGRVRTWKNGKWGRRSEPKLMTPSFGNTGYLRVNVDMEARLIHHLVLEAHVGPRPEGAEGAHWDGSRDNNSLTNLRWATKQGNGADNARLGVSKGERHSLHKLTDEAVRGIRERWGTYRQMAEEYDVSVSAVARVAQGKGWTHVQ